MKKWTIPILFCTLMFVSLGSAAAQTLDISSGGAPTIIGALSGSVTGSSSVLNNLSVTIAFGEVSPTNTNNIVKVVVPIAVRGDRKAYRVEVSITGSTGASAQAIQRSDIGFGVNNFRSMGANAQVCNNTSHIFQSPFSNDPAANVTINGAGRATYPSTLNNIGVSTIILTGPRLSKDITPMRQTNNGYIFDAIFTITPQFYAAGTTSATVTFTIFQNPDVTC